VALEAVSSASKDHLATRHFLRKENPEPRKPTAARRMRRGRFAMMRVHDGSDAMPGSATKAKQRVSLRHHGRKMSLKEFEFVELEEGCIAELSRGYIVTRGTPNLPHGLQISEIRSHLGCYDCDRALSQPFRLENTLSW